MVGGRGRRAVDQGGGLSLGTIGACAAFFDDGVEFADGVVDVCFCAPDAARAGGRGVGTSTRWGREA